MTVHGSGCARVPVDPRLRSSFASKMEGPERLPFAAAGASSTSDNLFRYQISPRRSRTIRRDLMAESARQTSEGARIFVYARLLRVTDPRAASIAGIVSRRKMVSTSAASSDGLSSSHHVKIDIREPTKN